MPINQLQPLATAHLTSLEILSWPVVHDPHLELILRWLPELRAAADAHGALAAREPWRLAAGYARVRSLKVSPRRDSPLWVMSVNRNNWPEYQQMMTGVAHTVRFEPSSAEVLSAATGDYPPPCVPPLELEIRLDRIPVDHSWGDAAKRAKPAPPPRTPSATPAAAVPAGVESVPRTPSTAEALSAPPSEPTAATGGGARAHLCALRRSSNPDPTHRHARYSRAFALAVRLVPQGAARARQPVAARGARRGRRGGRASALCLRA